MTAHARAPYRFGATALGFVSGLFLFATSAWAADAPIEAFIGSYSGSAQLVNSDGSSQDRDMSVEISESKNGFTVKWTTITFKSGGRTTEKSYTINFVPAIDDGMYSAAMKRDLFGNDVPLDPMKGEPYVWGQIAGDTLTVYALFVEAGGGYQIQQYDRTLAEGGLDLEFNSFRNGEQQRTISAFLRAE